MPNDDVTGVGLLLSATDEDDEEEEEEEEEDDDDEMPLGQTARVTSTNDWMEENS